MPQRFRAAIAATSYTVVRLGLHLLGWGLDDLRGFFANPARTGLVVLSVLGIVLVATLFPNVKAFRKGKQAVGRVQLVAWTLLGAFLVWFLPYGDRRNILVFGENNALRYAGLGLLVVGGAVRLVALASLGQFFSGYVTLQEDHRLVQTGLYHVIRHPMYLGFLAAMPGFVLIFRSWLVIPMFVISAAFMLQRIAQEEKLLAQRFAGDFEEYRQRTWRLIPYLY